jgi:hypothetical protein
MAAQCSRGAARGRDGTWNPKSRTASSSGRRQGTSGSSPCPDPTDDEVREALRRIAERVRRLLRPCAEAAQANARVPDPIATLQAEAVSSPRGKPLDAARTKKEAAFLEGFSLHAGVQLHTNDREGLAHLCGYGARPPLVQDRLSQLSDGRLAYRLKRPLGDGREVLVLQPSELLRKLAALVPPPRAHLVRYHGVFAPASAWRSRIVSGPAVPAPCADLPDAQPSPPHPAEAAAKRRNRASRIPWARRVATMRCRLTLRPRKANGTPQRSLRQVRPSRHRQVRQDQRSTIPRPPRSPLG